MIRRAAVIGHPVAHSKSPLIHNYWARKYKIPSSYESIDIAPQNLERKIKKYLERSYIGFNITVPYKEKVFEMCDTHDEMTEFIGAVNTIIIRNGKMHGTNTDAYGFTQNIKTGSKNFNFKAGPAVVLGAGGASRAVLHALTMEGAPEIYLLNRTREKAENLANGIPRIRVVDWKKRSEILSGANLLVNTTSMGMKDQPELEIDLKALPETALVNDIVYVPLMTNLLQMAEKRGNPYVTGIGMLLHQAAPAFELFFGIRPQVDAKLEKLVLG